MGEYAANIFSFPDPWDITHAHMPGSVYPDTQLYRSTDALGLCLRQAGVHAGLSTKRSPLVLIPEG